MKFIRTTILLALLAFFVKASAANKITIGSVSGDAGTDVIVHVALQNTDPISALQLSIPLTGGLQYVDGSATLTNRKSDNHSITGGVKDGELQLMIYSVSMQSLNDNSGDVLTFKLRLGQKPQTILLTPSRITATNTEGNEVDISSEDGTVSVNGAYMELGSAILDYSRVPLNDSYERNVEIRNTGSDELNITAFQFSNTLFSTSVSLPLKIAAGSSINVPFVFTPNKRGDVNGRVDIVSNSASDESRIVLKAQPYAVNELHILPVRGMSDEVVTVHVTMNAMDAIQGLQLEFNMPQQFEYVDGSMKLVSDRVDDHQGIATYSNGKLTFIAYSPSGKGFKASQGDIVTFQVKLNGQYGTTLNFTKAILTAMIDGSVVDVLSDKSGARIDISSPSLSTVRNLDFGAVSVTESAEMKFRVNNYGSAPLVIDRIVFDTLGFKVNETLPITLEPWQNADITVVYEGMDQKPFKSLMQLYSNDPNQRLCNIQIAGSRYAPNFLGMSIDDPAVNNLLKVDVSLSNYDAVKGLQFDMVYPSDAYELYDDNVTVAMRAKGLTVTSRQINNNTARYFAYFLQDDVILPGSGTVLTIELSPKNVEIGQNFNVQIKDINIGDVNLKNRNSGTDLNKSFTIQQTDGIINPTVENKEIEGLWNLNGVSLPLGIKPPHGVYILKAKGKTRKVVL